MLHVIHTRTRLRPPAPVLPGGQWAPGVRARLSVNAKTRVLRRDERTLMHI